MKKIVKLPVDPLGIFSDFIGEDVKIEIPVPDYLAPLFKFQEGEEKAETEIGGEELGKWEESSEEGKVLNLLKAADKELKKGNIEGAHTHLDNAIGLSSCDRCKRGMRTIVQKIREGDLSEARRRLSEFMRLIPLYYEVLRREGSGLNTELGVSKDIEESCDTCVASEILEICNWDNRCLDKVIAYIDSQKAKGLKVMNDELVVKAKEYSVERG